MSTLGPKRDGLGPDNSAWVESRGAQYPGTCKRCGARRVDSQLGLEATPDQYVERLVAVFREVWRVLRDDGTVWLNLGDSYAGTPHWAGNGGRGQPLTDKAYGGQAHVRREIGGDGLKPKDLVGIPWRVAFALQTDGWYLRSAITWCKVNPMPESVQDRPTKATEMVFLLSKQPRYYYDQSAIAESSPDATGTANGASPSRSALRPEVRATFHAHDGATDTRGWHDFGQSQIAVDLAMATDAGRFQVLDPVGLKVGVEAPEGDLVMHLQRPVSGAVDASVAVALKRGLSLLPPVWAAVADIATAPSGALLAPGPTDVPSVAALARAECVAFDLARIAENLGAATITLAADEFRATLLVWGSLRPAHAKSIPPGRNKRDWWQIPTEPFPEAHFATYPQALVRPCILAGTSEHGECVECGAPWVREVDRTKAEPSYIGAKTSQNGDRNDEGRSQLLGASTVTTGWRASCSCCEMSVLDGIGAVPPMPAATRPQLVLDPFIGSGTTALVARNHARRCIGIDLALPYLEIAAKRLQQLSLLADPT